VRQSETAAARDVARSFGLINKQFTFVSASSPFAVHWPTTNTQHNGWLIVQIDLLALIRFYGLNSIEGQKMRTHTHTGTHNAHTHNTNVACCFAWIFLCFFKAEDSPFVIFSGYILYYIYSTPYTEQTAVFTWHREFTAPLWNGSVRSVVKIVHCADHCGATEHTQTHTHTRGHGAHFSCTLFASDWLISGAFHWTILGRADNKQINTNKFYRHFLSALH